MLSYCVFTNKGNREINEDSMRVAFGNNKMCFIVADGLGGHGKGEVASEYVVNGIANQFNDGVSIDNFLENAVLNAQIGLMEEQKRQNARNEMKTTVVALHIDGINAKWIHVGDARLYAFKGTKLVDRTKDHSVPQMLVLSGEIKEKQIRNHPDRSRLMKVMGVNWEEPQYTISNIHNLTKISAFLLCTDGFWELITEKEMSKLLKKSSTVNEWVNSMVEIINKNGAGTNMDNYTAIAVWNK